LTRKLSNDHDEYLGKFKNGIIKYAYHLKTARPTIVGGNIIYRKMTSKDAYPMMSGGGRDSNPRFRLRSLKKRLKRSA